eukprot:1180528-Prorocentrum_minimum.AAC.3
MDDKLPSNLRWRTPATSGAEFASSLVNSPRLCVEFTDLAGKFTSRGRAPPPPRGPQRMLPRLQSCAPSCAAPPLPPPHAAPSAAPPRRLPGTCARTSQQIKTNKS